MSGDGKRAGRGVESPPYCGAPVLDSTAFSQAACGSTVARLTADRRSLTARALATAEAGDAGVGADR